MQLLHFRRFEGGNSLRQAYGGQFRLGKDEKILLLHIKDQSFAYAVKSTTDWTTGGEGSNASGLDLLPGSMRRENGNFEDKGWTAFFWSPVYSNAEDNYF